MARTAHVVVAERDAARASAEATRARVRADDAPARRHLARGRQRALWALHLLVITFSAAALGRTAEPGVERSAWLCAFLLAGLLATLPLLRWQGRVSERVVDVSAAGLLLLLAAAWWLPQTPPGPDLSRPLVLVAAAGALAVLLAHAPVLSGAAATVPAVMLWPAPPGVAPLETALALGGLALLSAAAQHAWRLEAHRRFTALHRLQEAERAREEAVAASQDKTRFLSAASHDLRQPVHALGLFAATLDKRLAGSREQPLVRNIVRSIEGLDRSLNAVMDISRLDAGQVQPNFQHFPLRDLFRRLHMQFAGQAELSGLNLRFSPGGKWVTSDPQWLERILANLIQNALKYTAQGGVAVVARTAAGHFHVEVWDTGPGIPAAELPRIFDEYYQVRGHGGLRPQGMGMGLAIVRRLVRLLGHGLTIASAPGRGTMFRVIIRQRGAPEVEDLTAPADTQPMALDHPRTVLVVEDDEAVREGLAMLLEEAGYVALSAASLEQARQTLRVLERPPDLLLTDLHLGPGGDGLDVIAELRRACARDLPVIVITGDIAPEQNARLQSLPVLFKPVDARRLMQQVRRLVA